jgi:hypothetical protein
VEKRLAECPVGKPRRRWDNVALRWIFGFENGIS